MFPKSIINEVPITKWFNGVERIKKEVNNMPIYHKYDDEFLEKLWSEFGNIPINDDECIEEDWQDFGKGTHREEIWDFFDRQHSKGVYYLMYEYKSRR